MRITASHIVEWANTKAKEAQTNLPRLIRRLCFDTTATRQLSFPAGDSTYVPGWDGVLFREQGDAWAPVGTSYWEIGCDQDPTTKASGEYQKRSIQTGVEDRASATFVFVTPRRWTTKTRWIAAQRAKGADDDGIWPFSPAREVLDRPDMEEMRTGFVIGIHNKRGVTSRSPWDGGNQERDLAGSYRSQAVRVQYSHPNMAATLEKIAKSYEREGTREDVDASLRKEGY